MTTTTLRSLTLRDHEARRLHEHGTVLVVRAIKPQPEPGGRIIFCPYTNTGWAIEEPCGACTCKGIRPLGRVGERRWVRETYCSQGWCSRQLKCAADSDPDEIMLGSVCYKADGEDWWVKRVERKLLARDVKGHLGWYSASQMPRWASRHTVEIVRVEARRVDSITEEEAINAGSQAPASVLGYRVQAAWRERQAFANIWDRRNPKHPFAAEPWAWFVEARKVEG